MANTRVDQSPKHLKSVASDSIQEFADLDEIELDELDEKSVAETGSEAKPLFVKSTDIRRRIEEQLEVRMLRDELGMDDFDL